MARKTLLTEGELRRFMSLAEIRPVSDGRIEEMGFYDSPPGARDLEEDEEEEERKDDEIGDLEGDLGAADVALDAPMDEPMDEPMDAPMDDLGAEEAPPLDPEAQAILAKGIQAMADAMGMGDLVTVDVEPEGPEAEDVVDMTDIELEEPGLDEPGLGGPEGGEFSPEQPDEDEDPMPGNRGRYQESNEDDIVAEVARRVASRLQKENRQSEVVDQLAERIMKRLTK
tara:strand:+ start:329 stop:1009 length:681 start_codon:yes stop_codon:yes gene_type:complete